MKANLIVITFITFLLAFAFRIASMASMSEIDNVNYQQLELHKSILAQKKLETLARYDQIEINKEDIESSFLDIDNASSTIELKLKGGDSNSEGMVLEKGTVVYWINESLTPNVLVLEDEDKNINEDFGENILRAGDRFYYKFDEVKDWQLVNSNASGTFRCSIKVVE